MLLASRTVADRQELVARMDFQVSAEELSKQMVATSWNAEVFSLSVD